MAASARSSARSPRSALSITPPARVYSLAPPRSESGTGTLRLDAVSRAERRKRRTRERLLDAALEVFLARGYDAATTGAIARAADLGAGTFYCHFRDKRAAFEGLADRTAHAIMERWTAALKPEMSVARGAMLALETAATHWRNDPDSARLLLEGGPSFGTAAHLRLVDEFAAILRARFTRRHGTRLPSAEARAVAALVVGLAIEIGRLVLGGNARQSAPALRRLIRIAGEMTADRAGRR